MKKALLRISAAPLSPFSSSLIPCKSLSTSRTALMYKCELSEVTVPPISFPAMCWSRVAEFGSQTALIDGATGSQLTFTEARSLAKAFGSGLLRLGASKGDVMAIIMPNSPDYVVTFLGASEAGLVVTTLNPIYTSHEIRGQLTNSEAKYVVTTPLLLPKVKEALGDSQAVVIVAGKDSEPNLSLSSLLKDSGDMVDSCHPPSSEDLCVLPYSSGTTGVPKGVMLTHANLVANMAQLNHPALDLMKDGETTICVLPLFHIFAMNVTMSNMLLNGGKLVTLPSFDPGQFLDAMLEHRPTFLHVAPPLVGFLASHPLVTEDHLSSLRQIFCAAAPAGPALIELFNRRAPEVRFREGYGMTEMAPAVTFVRGTHLVTGGSTGQLVPNSSMKVLDLVTGEELGVGETGELCFKGPQVMPGYFKNSEATASTLVDGWCHTGDIGYYNEDGMVFLVDRKKELIKVKGLQVAPAELENHIRGLEGVTDVAVIGVANARAGEVPRAYVVKGKEGLTEEDVKGHVAAALSPHKHLAGGVEFVEQIPKSAAGKILRKDLKASYQQNINGA